MLVSVIIPVFNVEKYLVECLDSILQQSMSEIEILLINDGSTDRSGAICDRYASVDPRIRVSHTPNRGVSSARNMGLDQASGDYILFIDSDDWVDSTHVSNLVEAEAGEEGITFTGVVRHFSEKVTLVTLPAADFRDEECGRAINLLKRLDAFGWTVNKLFSRKIIEQYHIRFDTTLSYREDELFTAMYCLHIHRIVLLPVATYHYRLLQSGLTRSRKKSSMILLAAEAIHRLYLDRYPDPENRYLASRILLSEACYALRMATTTAERSAAYQCAAQTYAEYRRHKRAALIRDRRDEKVAYRSGIIFATSGFSTRMPQLLSKYIKL